LVPLLPSLLQPTQLTITSFTTLRPRPAHGESMKFTRTHSRTGQWKISRLDSELLSKVQLKVSHHHSHQTMTSPRNSIQDNNGQIAFTPSETKLNAVHAGLSVPQKLFQTDSVLLQTVLPMLSSHQKISSLATAGTWDATVVSSHGPGHISLTLVLLLTLASHTPQIRVLSPSALQPAKMVQTSRNTSARPTQLSKQPTSTPSRLRS